MERNLPNEHRLRGIFMSPRANSPGERLQIARIFRQANFGLGKERKYKFFSEIFLSLEYNSKTSTTQDQYPVHKTRRDFNISIEKNKMRQTNFSVGRLNAGYDTCYNG